MEAVVKVQNIKCGGCANTIQNKLERIHGVDAVTVNPEEGNVIINCQDETDLAAAIYKLNKLGYPLDSKVNSIGKKASSNLSNAKGGIGSN